jgi:hypothetical protein
MGKSTAICVLIARDAREARRGLSECNLRSARNRPRDSARSSGNAAAVADHCRLQFLTARVGARHMVLKSRGAIVMLSASLSGEFIPSMSGITAACGAIEATTRTLAAEFGPSGYGELLPRRRVARPARSRRPARTRQRPWAPRPRRRGGVPGTGLPAILKGPDGPMSLAWWWPGGGGRACEATGERLGGVVPGEEALHP